MIRTENSHLKKRSWEKPFLLVFSFLFWGNTYSCLVVERLTCYLVFLYFVLEPPNILLIMMWESASSDTWRTSKRFFYVNKAGLVIYFIWKQISLFRLHHYGCLPIKWRWEWFIGVEVSWRVYLRGWLLRLIHRASWIVALLSSALHRSRLWLGIVIHFHGQLY